MSSYSFSHQFYQHWTGAPEPVRAAIIAELTDITDLLQTETPFEDFVFSTHDLDAHLDDLYGAHEKQQAAAKESAEKQAKLREAAEQQRLQEKHLEDQRLEKQRLDAEKEAEKKAKIEKKAEPQHKDEKSPSTEVETNTKDNASASSKVIVAKPSKDAAVNLLSIDSKLSLGHEDFIRELEMHVDDYLTEQMAQISEDLKSWLRSEVNRQLTEQELKQEQVITSDAKKKA